MMAKSTLGKLADDIGAAAESEPTTMIRIGMRRAVDAIRATDNPKAISDGFHTFSELYAHRRALVLMLMRAFPALSWRTDRHHPDDSPMFDDSFMIGIDSPAGPIRYHVGVEHRALFGGIREVEHAPLWDGAGPDATVDRLLRWSAMWWPSSAGLDDEEPDRDGADELETEPFRTDHGDPLG